MPELTLPDFVNKWRNATLTERAGSQMHFLELCDVLREPHPAAPAMEDYSDATYTFEKGVATTAGGLGFADVWKRGCFAWEYKGKGKDLQAPTGSFSNIARTLKILPCSSFAIWSGSKSIPTSPAPPSRFTALRSTTCS